MADIIIVFKSNSWALFSARCQHIRWFVGSIMHIFTHHVPPPSSPTCHLFFRQILLYDALNLQVLVPSQLDSIIDRLCLLFPINLVHKFLWSTPCFYIWTSNNSPSWFLTNWCRWFRLSAPTTARCDWSRSTERAIWLLLPQKKY